MGVGLALPAAELRWSLAARLGGFHSIRQEINTHGDQIEMLQPAYGQKIDFDRGGLSRSLTRAQYSQRQMGKPTPAGKRGWNFSRFAREGSHSMRQELKTHSDLMG